LLIISNIFANVKLQDGRSAWKIMIVEFVDSVRFVPVKQTSRLTGQVGQTEALRPQRI
jgi:hypothetical protein